ncbi:hypothetical protein CA237_03615 [Sphingomonas sp. ABOLH]|nr:hypothetical protein CA237_03615 [Sphingomonas sp. ABOLH]
MMRILARSPAASLSSSTGTIYPIVRRLRARGYLTASEVEGSSSAASHLGVTASGREAALEWIGGPDRAQVHPYVLSWRQSSVPMPILTA